MIRKVQAGAHLRVDAYNRDIKTKLASGTLTTIDNQIDQSTGTLKLRATFDNSRNELFPNQFVNARLLVEEKRGVTLIPTAAVQRNNQMTYVWAIKPDSTVTVQKIETGVSEGSETEVTSGLEPGDARGDDRRRQASGKGEGERPVRRRCGPPRPQGAGTNAGRPQNAAGGQASPANPSPAAPGPGDAKAHGAGGGKGKQQQSQ